jgi:NAD-dependent deacetylase sirtuin 5
MDQAGILPVLQVVIDRLRQADYILALLGAGLSASSGIPTFSGSGKTWRGFEAKDLATPEMFFAKPQVVWRYYSEFREIMNVSRPNRGHGSLALLAQEKPEFFCVTQNIDGIYLFVKWNQAHCFRSISKSGPFVR